MINFSSLYKIWYDGIFFLYFTRNFQKTRYKNKHNNSISKLIFRIPRVTFKHIKKEDEKKKLYVTLNDEINLKTIFVPSKQDFWKSEIIIQRKYKATKMKIYFELEIYQSFDFYKIQNSKKKQSWYKTCVTTMFLKIITKKCIQNYIKKTNQKSFGSSWFRNYTREWNSSKDNILKKKVKNYG